ncbi:NAD(P)/FAD-dependent oxidoreductase [Pseudonocardia hispaniensis]|uniref:NAD(P)/FAD-dependent oxidoreductase n=1 Tax=Pseudonocardia hispaniensis TaxID=904933 RepID=A0ABW1J9A8_9PSEU
MVIVGGSVAGVRTARALREQGYPGVIRVIEAEAEPPYDKPPLSKAALDGNARVPLMTLEEARELDIELSLGRRATGLLTPSAHLVFGDGTVMGFDDLVVATGVRPRPAPWRHEGVHVLRTWADAAGLRARLATSRHLLVVGAGFLGAELAALARRHGIEVTMVDPAAVPMSRAVGSVLGERFSALHRRHGVDTRFGTLVTMLEPSGGGFRAELADGSVVLPDTVVVAIGSDLDLDWLEASGLPVDDGIICDEYGRVVGFPNVHAVGDVARWHRPRSGTSARVEHWTNAVEQANSVAHNILHPGAPIAHDPVGYVWSDQYDWKIQLIGTRDPDRRPEIFEQDEPFRLAAIWQGTDGRVTGGATVNWPKASVWLRTAVKRGSHASSVRDQLGAVAVLA